MADVLLSEGICSSRSHICEWKNGPDDSLCIMILLCRLISDDMIVLETVCLWRVVCATRCGCVPLDSSCVLQWIDTVVFYWMALF
jgi:hypothetical protein